jgi:cell division septum initiation protein DivIVA
MSETEQILTTFSTRVRQLILKYKDIEKQNQALKEKIAQQKEEIDKLNNSLAQAQDDFNNLKMAKMIEITDDDLEGAKKRLSKLIRDVNKCITLLSEK